MTVVRFATPTDIESLMSCLRMMHEENGLFSLDENRVRAVIARALNPNPPPNDMPPLIGVIGSPGDVEATICLILNQLYYTEDWHMTDLWCFIRPDCRKKNLIEELLEFAKTSAAGVHLQFFTGVISNKRTEAKVRIFSRHFGKPLGAAFLYDPEKRAH